MLPGVLILGSLGTLCAELLRQRTGRAWRLAGAERVGFRHFVQPGDQLVFTVTLKELCDDEATLAGEAAVERQGRHARARPPCGPRRGGAGS